ncbi:hypothetical protein [Anaerospora sp.]|uniref:hypothetical protein n=1 Tax=Anaerospora sp. TaxID=1960278 RepID=UPI0028A1D0DB|nr:hypothetical protein [Anaerospora sp.]
MNERQYIIDTFKNKFADCVNKKIVLYGISNNTKHILDSFSDFQFLGVMDGYKTGESIYGKRILSNEEVLELKTDIIIIIARANSTKIICKRIAKFCKSHKIELFDLNGVNLLKNNDETVKNHPYFSVDEKLLREEILKHDIISFDIFDTLVMRKVLYPHDIFELVSRNMQSEFKDDFVKQRIDAERDLSVDTIPTLCEIYARIQENTGISTELSDQLMQNEIDTDKSVLVPRKKMTDIFNFAITSEKKVYLISDMYLPRNLLEEILENLGIVGYQDVFISCEYRTSKSQNLYKVFKEKIQGQSYLHIGDNLDIDGTYAQINGIDSFHIYSAGDMLEISAYKNVLGQAETLDERILTGMFLAKVFNDPFALYKSEGRMTINNAYDMGYLFIAPLITAFMVWLVQKVKMGYDKILFSARDGYIFNKLYDSIGEPEKRSLNLPQNIYFLISRMSAISASIFCEEDILYASQIAFDDSPEKLLKKRFLLEDREILPYQKEKYETLQQYVLSHKKEILSKSMLLRKQYFKYINTLNLKENDRLAFFDFVSSATCQMCLINIVSQKISGLYFIHFFEEYHKKTALTVESFLESGYMYGLQSYLFTNYLFMESIIVSSKPTLSHFDQKGNPIYLEESRTDKQLVYISEVQQAIMNYFKEYMVLNSKLENGIRSQFADQVFSLIQQRYSIVENCEFEANLSRDEFCNREYTMTDMFK